MKNEEVANHCLSVLDLKDIRIRRLANALEQAKLRIERLERGWENVGLLAAIIDDALICAGEKE